MTENEKDKISFKTAGSGQYYLVEKIAKGGMAEIFKGLSYDLNGLKKIVCIKRILREITANKDFVDSLIDEAKIAVNLSHGNIAQIYDLGKVDNDYFMVMEYVDGKTLSQVMRKANQLGYRIPIDHISYIISEVANGLDYIHRRSDDKGTPLHIVHCDISPQNIMISQAGTVKIIDFGIAKAAIKEEEAGILKGKFSYMSPEQSMGEAIDHRSDIYSLGIILHEMLTGKRLFKAEDKRETLRNVREAKVSPPSLVTTDIPEELDKVAMRALAKDRRFRYPLASEMRDDLQKYLHTNHADFISAELSELLVELFGEELSQTSEDEAKELNTPYLIIDHKKSAIASEEEEYTGRGDSLIDMKEFIVEEESEFDREEKTPSHIEEEPLNTKPKKADHKKRIFFIIGIFWSVTILLILLFILLITSKEDKLPVQEIKKIDISEAQKEKPAIKEMKKIEKPIQQFGTIVVTSSPPGATIYLDEEQTQFKTPIALEGIAPNKKHKLGLWAENYLFWSRGFSLKAQETQNFHIELAIDYSTLKIISQPSGASVYLDDVFLGATPIDMENILPGKIYTVEFRLEGYRSKQEEIETKPGKETFISVKLERLK
ncbi:MAG: serine/threonine-protein kinase [Pseudomonadota bacterium]